MSSLYSHYFPYTIQIVEKEDKELQIISLFTYTKAKYNLFSLLFDNSQYEILPFLLQSPQIQEKIKRD